MAIELTPDRLQSISIKVVTDFMTKKASLNQAVSQEAKSLELTPDQIKRVIEASNSIAYLRQLQDTGDRTFEFPVADYDQVLADMVTPTETLTPVLDPLSQTACVPEVQTKQAGLRLDLLNEHEKLAMVAKEVISQKRYHTKLADDKVILHDKIVKASTSLKKQANLVEKLTYLGDDGSLAKLLQVDMTKQASHVLLRDKDLVDLRALQGLIKQAQELTSEYAALSETLAQAEEFLGLEKKALLVDGIAKALTKGALSVPKAVTKAVGNSFKRSAGMAVATKKIEAAMPEAAQAAKDKALDAAVKQFHEDRALGGPEYAARRNGFSLPPKPAVPVTFAGVASVLGASSITDKKENVWDRLHPQGIPNPNY